MTDRTAKDRVARHRERRMDQGWVRVAVWVRAEDREKILEFAETLRKMY